MNIEQSMVLKGAYIVMKAKLLKYESQVKRKQIFHITIILDMSVKLEYIPMDEQECIMKHLKHLLQLVPIPPTSSTCTQGETFLNNSKTFSKLMVELIKRNMKRNMNISLERPISDKIFYYLHDFQVESYLHALQWWCKIRSEKYRQLVVLTRGFL